MYADHPYLQLRAKLNSTSQARGFFTELDYGMTHVSAYPNPPCQHSLREETGVPGDNPTGCSIYCSRTLGTLFWNDIKWSVHVVLEQCLVYYICVQPCITILISYSHNKA